MNDHQVVVSAIRNGDISRTGEISGSARRWFTHREAEKAEARPGDILLTSSGEIGKVHLVREGMYHVTNFVKRIRPNRDKLEPGFLAYMLKSPVAFEVLQEYSAGSTMMNLKAAFFEHPWLPLPPLVEQQRIVAKLDTAFAALAEVLANVERNRANARELFESCVNGVFEEKGEWATRPLCEIIHVKHGFAFLGEHFSAEGEYVLLTMGNFHETGGYRDRGDKQKYYAGPFPQEFLLSEGDLVVAMTEQAAGLLGAPLLVPGSGKYLHNQRIGLVQQPNGRAVLNEFLFHVFNTKPFRDAVHASGSGVKVRHTSPTKIGEVEISYPRSLKEQQLIVDRLAELEQHTRELEATYQQKLTELAGLKKSVLGAAFRGEL